MIDRCLERMHISHASASNAGRVEPIQERWER
jgi:hypothetical protein